MRAWIAMFAAVGACGLMAFAAPGDGRLDWLIGTWRGEGGGAQQGAGDFSFRREAGGQVIVRHSYADYPAQNGRPASHHDDFMIIEGAGAATTARYWDSEGQAIHYAVTAPQPGMVVFLSDDPAGPRFRLTYRRTPSGLDGSFEIAPPDHRDQFKPYLSWTARKTG